MGPLPLPLSGVVAKTPLRGLRVLWGVGSRVRGFGGIFGLFQGCSGVFGRGVGVCGCGYGCRWQRWGGSGRG